MTILDAQNLFSDRQAVTASASSENVIDLLQDRNLAAGEQIFLDVRVVEAFTAGGAATLNVQVRQADDEGMSSNLEVLQETGQILVADLGLGWKMRLPVMPRNDRRYLDLNYVVTTGPMTAGAINAGMALDVEDTVAYPGVVG